MKSAINARQKQRRNELNGSRQIEPRSGPEAGVLLRCPRALHATLSLGSAKLRWASEARQCRACAMYVDGMSPPRVYQFKVKLHLYKFSQRRNIANLGTSWGCSVHYQSLGRVMQFKVSRLAESTCKYFVSLI